MIYSYGITQQGKAHKRKGVVCQDAHLIKHLSDDCCVAAIADGLGSERYSDIASKIAVESVIQSLDEGIKEDFDDNDIIELFRKCYIKAYDEICSKAKDDGNDINQYDTTLSLVYYRKDKIYWGHSGDGGIIVLNKSGEYKVITNKQRDENGFVFPLCFKDKWDFGITENVASVLLATDGMLETLFPSLLFNEPVPIYVALAQFFMDNKDACKNSTSLEKRIFDFIDNIDEKQVSDDKTIVCLQNIDVDVQRKDDGYYKIPDWAALKKKKDEEFRRLAYPNLYKQNNNIE